MPLLIVLCLATLLIWHQQPWSLRLLQAAVGIAGVAGLFAQRRSGTTTSLPASPSPATLVAGACLAAAAILGLLQNLTSQSAAQWTTWSGALDWAALAAVFAGVTVAATTHTRREQLLHIAAVFSVAVCLLAMAQFYSSGGRLFWLWPTAEAHVPGPFRSRNNFASFAALLLPLALWKAIHKKRTDWLWMAASAFLYSSAVASGSRAGAALATIEIPIFFLLSRRYLSSRFAIRAGAGFACAALLFVAIGGWELLSTKITDQNPLKFRKEMIASAIEMARQRPLSGWGLGSFPIVYPRFASFDSGHFVNHAHNDWAEWAADGGLPLVALMALFAFLSLRAALRKPWALGIAAVFLHSIVDFPMQRLGVAAWVVAMAALAIAASTPPHPPPQTHQTRTG
ncbi:MAG: O-antigen ligase family protein [Acidobacteria bacterium]|nr:O-antigen ligase family protein [Acidobacteriota bacterium]